MNILYALTQNGTILAWDYSTDYDDIFNTGISKLGEAMYQYGELLIVNKYEAELPYIENTEVVKFTLFEIRG